MSQPSTTEEQRLAHGERVVAHLRAGGTLGDLMGVQDAELDAAYAMACFFYERDEYDTALRLFGLLLAANPFETRYLIGMGMTQQVLKNYDDAIGYYASALVFDFDDPLPGFHTAECLVHKGQPEDALTTLSVCLSRANGPAHAAIKQKALELQGLLLAAKAAQMGKSGDKEPA